MTQCIELPCGVRCPAWEVSCVRCCYICPIMKVTPVCRDVTAEIRRGAIHRFLAENWGLGDESELLCQNMESIFVPDRGGTVAATIHCRIDLFGLWTAGSRFYVVASCSCRESALYGMVRPGISDSEVHASQGRADGDEMNNAGTERTWYEAADSRWILDGSRRLPARKFSFYAAAMFHFS